MFAPGDLMISLDLSTDQFIPIPNPCLHHSFALIHLQQAWCLFLEENLCSLSNWCLWSPGGGSWAELGHLRWSSQPPENLKLPPHGTSFSPNHIYLCCGRALMYYPDEINANRCVQLNYCLCPKAAPQRLHFPFVFSLLSKSYLPGYNCRASVNKQKAEGFAKSLFLRDYEGELIYFQHGGVQTISPCLVPIMKAKWELKPHLLRNWRYPH